MNPADFIEFMRAKAQEVAYSTGIPPEVMIAQAALETGWGSHILRDKYTGMESNSLFNIRGRGPAGSVIADDLEYHYGHPRVIEARFRAYFSPEQSCDDYAALMHHPKYAPAMAVRHSPVEFARQVHKCGYSVDPAYSDKLISIMNKYFAIDGKD